MPANFAAIAAEIPELLCYIFATRAQLLWLPLPQKLTDNDCIPRVLYEWHRMGHSWQDILSHFSIPPPRTRLHTRLIRWREHNLILDWSPQSGVDFSKLLDDALDEYSEDEFFFGVRGDYDMATFKFRPKLDLYDCQNFNVPLAPRPEYDLPKPVAPPAWFYNAAQVRARYATGRFPTLDEWLRGHRIYCQRWYPEKLSTLFPPPPPIRITASGLAGFGVQVPIKIPVYESDTDESDPGSDVSDFDGDFAGRGYNAKRIDALKSGATIYDRVEGEKRATVQDGWSFLGNPRRNDNENDYVQDQEDDLQSASDVSPESDLDERAHDEEDLDEADFEEADQDGAEQDGADHDEAGQDEADQDEIDQPEVDRVEARQDGEGQAVAYADLYNDPELDHILVNGGYMKQPKYRREDDEDGVGYTSAEAVAAWRYCKIRDEYGWKQYLFGARE